MPQLTLRQMEALTCAHFEGQWSPRVNMEAAGYRLGYIGPGEIIAIYASETA